VTRLSPFLSCRVFQPALLPYLDAPQNKGRISFSRYKGCVL